MGMEERSAATYLLDIGMKSIVGTREEQQDAVFSANDRSSTIVAVCDGMGGLAAGKQASITAIKALETLFSQRDKRKTGADFYLQAVEVLDESVYALRNATSGQTRVGTTIVSAFVSQERLYWLSVGDSRMYLIRGNEVACVTTDHNYRYLLDREFQRGKMSAAEYHKEVIRGNALISYIGMGGVDLVDVNKSPFMLKHGDIIVLASDGLYQNLENNEILWTAQQYESACDIAGRLINLVQNKHRPNQDNASVVVVKVMEE